MNQIAKLPLLIVIHPGSACGSATMNLGHDAAAASRDLLARDITAWSGGIIIVDGELSDELKGYPALDKSLKAALRRAKSAKLVSGRLFACDNLGPDLGIALPIHLRKLQVTPDSYRIDLTGAWATSHGNWGCVNGAYQAVTKHGFDATIRESAIAEQDEE